MCRRRCIAREIGHGCLRGRVSTDGSRPRLRRSVRLRTRPRNSQRVLKRHRLGRLRELEGLVVGLLEREINLRLMRRLDLVERGVDQVLAVLGPSVGWT